MIFWKFEKISENPGDASKLKLLRSMYTKSLSAVLIESSEVAKNLNLEEEFFDILSLTEGEDFKKKALCQELTIQKFQKKKG